MASDDATAHAETTRVVIRYSLPEPDPATGARFSDAVGTLIEDTDEHVIVATERGQVVIPRGSVVASRIVPPTPSRRGAPHRALSIEDLERVMVGAWPPIEQARLGDWILRAGGGWTGRANSALLIGSPDRGLEEALTTTDQWYASRHLSPRLALPLPLGADLDADEIAATALGRGWRPTGDPVLVLTAATREVALLEESSHPVRVSETMTDDWYAGLADYRSSPRPAVEAILQGSPEQRFALVREPGGPVVQGIGRLGASDGWGGIGAMWVDPAARGRGVGTAILRSLALEAQTLGLVSLHLQVEVGNTGARALYERAGFRPHHVYVYFTR